MAQVVYTSVWKAYGIRMEAIATFIEIVRYVVYVHFTALFMLLLAGMWVAVSVAPGLRRRQR